MNKLIKNPFERMQKGAVIILCTLFLMVSGCGKSDTENNDIYLKNFELSSCQSRTRATDEYIEYNREYVKFSAVNNSTLKVEHRIFLNCCVEDPGVIINSEGNEITISIKDGISCNCGCPIMVNYEIGNLQENNTYKFTFLKAYS